MKAEILDTTTGEVRKVDLRLSDADFNEFIWVDGNFACDCNRADFFEGATTDTPCGQGRYKMLAITNDDGKLLYSEAYSPVAAEAK